MKNTTHLLILFLFCSVSFRTIAQQDTCTQKLMSFARNINTFNRLHPQEKAYLHFDNIGYYVGETIWFKAYVVTAEQNKPTELSRILYVELVSPEGFVMETRKLKIENGQCDGEFLLKDSLYAGYYEVRAYTANMLNFGQDKTTSKLTPEVWGETKEETRIYGNDDVFSRVLPVYDKPSKEGDYNEKTMRERPRINIQFKKKKTPETIYVSFYPEGGNLINGLTSKVAFKAVSEKGEDIVVSGSVRDSKGDEVTTFNTIHDGTGAFCLCPQGKKYMARVRYKEKTYTFNLPKSLPSGYVMTLDNLPEDHLLVQIEKSDDMTHPILGLSISCRGRVYFFDTLQVTGEPYILKLPKSLLPSGVNQLTLFNAQGDILSDRLFFIDHQEYKQISFKATKNKEFYQPFEKVDIDFQLKDTTGNPIESDFSLAVRDESTEDITYNTENILTNLLLSSDLKGFIKDPAYYFESADRQRKLDLDLLLMTQGWRRYSWRQEAGQDSYKERNKVEKGLAVNGMVTYRIKTFKEEEAKVKAQDTEITATIKVDSLTMNGSCKIDKNGKFSFLVDDFNGKADLTLLAFNKNDKPRDYYIQLTRILLFASRMYSYYETAVPYEQSATSIKSDTLPGLKGQTLSEVTVTVKKRKRNKIDFSRPNLCLDFQDMIDLEIDIEDYDTGYDYYLYCSKQLIYPYIAFMQVVGYMGSTIPCFDYIPEYQIKHAKVEISSIAEDSYSYFHETNTLPPERIETITIYKDMATRERYKNSMTGSVPETVISYNSYKNGYSRPKNNTHERYTTLQGYSYVKDFYSPVYDHASLPKQKDFRRTLYWNPDVKTDSTGKASVHFYNNSTCKSMKISAETLTKGGIPVVCKE